MADQIYGVADDGAKLPPVAVGPPTGRQMYAARLSATPPDRPIAIEVKPNALAGVRIVTEPGMLCGQFETYARYDIELDTLIPFCGRVSDTGRVGYNFILPVSGKSLVLDPDLRCARALSLCCER